MRRVFLDENVDLALSKDFDVFISHDKGLVHQQQWSDRDLACIVIDSRSTRATSYIEGRQALMDAINGASPGTVTALKI